MEDKWKKDLACAVACGRCQKKLASTDLRILSVYDHQAICLDCKKNEEAGSDYETVSKNTIGNCMTDSEINYGDPSGYCYHHFYPFKCT